MSLPGPPPDLRPLLARLQAAGLADDATQLLDALWLSRWLPGPVAAMDEPNSVTPPIEPRPEAATPPPLAAPPQPPRTRGPEAEVPLPSAAPTAADAGAGVYARVAGTPADDAWRARALRVAGVPALRDGPALARALRPLGKRRRSTTRFVIDEAATAERLADTGLLAPVLVPERERFFSATLLVEDSPAMPLWRGLADELETLLARQGGFRRLRRLALLTDGAQPMLRSRSGALQSPRMLLEDDASLVLIATDGTSAAWADGRMAALTGLLAPRTCVAVLQWMPERLWPHSALGAADLGVQAPRPGAPLAELRLTRPRWLRAHRPVQPMPVAALTPASLGRLAAMLMAKPGVRGAAALLWPATSAPPPGAAAGEEDLSQLNPEQRISRFRAVGSARLLQAAVQLSAAAPLTLPVVRLVHRVMQPGAPAEDLPLLLLGGLLQRQPAPPADEATGGDDDVVFDFAPGVRQALQAALLKHEADEVRRAVSGYIAERSGSPLDFQALMRDEQGALRLPAWARPFAEVTRQVQALYQPPAAPSADAGPPAPSVREPQWAPGVTVQAETALPADARKLAWSPDGQRLAVLHQQGLVTFQLQPTGPGQRRWQREPLAMRGPSTVFMVQGFDVPQPLFQAFVEAFQATWPALFNQPLQLQFHTVGSAYGEDLRRRPEQNLRQLLDLVERQQGLMLCVGGTRFFESAWVGTAQEECLRRFDLQQRVPALSLRMTPASAAAAPAADWKLMSMFNGPAAARIEAAMAPGAARTITQLLADQAPRYLSQVLTGPTTTDLLWTTDDRLLVADGLSGEVLDADTSATVDRAPPGWDRQHPLLLAQRPGERSLTLARGQDLNAELPGYASLQRGADRMEAPIAALAWSADGEHLALLLANGTVRFLWASEKPDDDAERDDLHGIGCGPAWTTLADDALAVWRTDGDVQVQNGRQSLARWAAPDEVTSLSWSHDDDVLACGLHGGGLQLVHGGSSGRPATQEVPNADADGGAPQLAFAPQPIGGGQDALALACGSTLTLLRIDRAALQAGAVPEAPAPPEPAHPDPDEVVDSAHHLLMALAMAFRDGGFGEGGRSGALDDYARRLGVQPGQPDWTLLHTLLLLANDTLTEPLHRMLQGEGDRLRHPDVDGADQYWHSSLDRLDKDLPMLSGRGTASDRQRALAFLQAWLSQLEGALAGMSSDEQAQLDDTAGFALWRWFAAIAALRDPRLARDTRAPLTKLKPLLQRVAQHLPALRSQAVADLISAPLARAMLLHAECGTSVFSGCPSSAELVSRFASAFAQQAELLLQGRDMLTVHSEVPAWRLAQMAPLLAPLEVGLQWAASGSPWSLPCPQVPALIRFVGAIVATRLAWLNRQPPPDDWAVPGLPLLWVDDQPQHNLGGVRALQERGFRVATTRDTASALRALKDVDYAAVISDMGRPPDPQAGYTLLQAMRDQHVSTPFIILSRDVRPEHHAESVRRGALGSTDDFQVLMGWLRRELLQRPAIKSAA